MSRKKVKSKEARFTLEPDGFSIHTFELSRQLTKREYHAIKDALYRQSEYDDKGLIYKRTEIAESISVRFTLSTAFVSNWRITVTMTRTVTLSECWSILEPGASYLGILPPVKASVESVADAFAELFHDTALEADINAYKLRRVDLCTNVRCDHGKLFREMVRALRKLPTPPKYERCFYKHKDKKKATRYNKHYLRLHCGTPELVIYDKTYPMRENGFVVAYEKLPEGVLRFEFYCERQYLRKLEKKSGEPDSAREKFLRETLAGTCGTLERHIRRRYRSRVHQDKVQIT